MVALHIYELELTVFCFQHIKNCRHLRFDNIKVMRDRFRGFWSDFRLFVKYLIDAYRKVFKTNTGISFDF